MVYWISKFLQVKLDTCIPSVCFVLHIYVWFYFVSNVKFDKICCLVHCQLMFKLWDISFLLLQRYDASLDIKYFIPTCYGLCPKVTHFFWYINWYELVLDAYSRFFLSTFSCNLPCTRVAPLFALFKFSTYKKFMYLMIA